MSILRIQIVLISFNDGEYLKARLDELSPKFDCCVFLNGTTPSHQELTENYPSVRVIKGQENLGFAAAVNQSMKDINLHDVDMVLLLNPDCSPSVENIISMIEDIDNSWDRKIAMWSPQLVDEFGNKKRTAWSFPTRFESLRYLLRISDRKAEDYVVGACCFIRASAWRQVGEFDERFFMYAEEADWQRRASLLGFQSILINSKKVQHIGGGSSESARERKRQIVASRFQYYGKWFGSLAALIDMTLLGLAHGVRIVLGKGDQRSDHKESINAIVYVMGRMLRKDFP